MGCLNLLSVLYHSSIRSEFSNFSGYCGMQLHGLSKSKSVVKYLFDSGKEKLQYGSTLDQPFNQSSGIAKKKNV